MQRVYVLDEDMSLQPVELPERPTLAAPGSRYGYLNRADLTAERFVADPFGPAGATASTNPVIGCAGVRGRDSNSSAAPTSNQDSRLPRRAR